MSRNNLLRDILTFTAFSLAILVAPLRAQVAYTDLYEFDDAHGCCVQYPGLLAQGQDGNLYGGTFSEGKYGYGTAFQMSVGGGLTTLHDFDSSDGAGVWGGLSMGLDGNFYGTTYQGGGQHFGTIFQVKPDGTFTPLYNFANAGDGAYPKVPPTPAPDGNLYGVTGNGTVAVAYRITPAGKFTVLTTIPSQSYSPLVLGGDGLLYGMTEYGGDFNQGTAFSLSTKGALKVIHSFNGGGDGAQPVSPLLLAADGNFYGTTSDGGPQSGGVVFKLSPSGKYSVLHSFQSVDNANGYAPTAGLVIGSDGFLYGFNSLGGALGDGTAFRLKTNGNNFTVLYTFDQKNGGGSPEATPILHTNGIIYGITQKGGLSDDGVFFSLDATLKPFIALQLFYGKVGATIPILGQGFNNAFEVQINGEYAPFLPMSDGYMLVYVTDTASSGKMAVYEYNGVSYISLQNFLLTPQIISFDPPSGPVGTKVTIQGKGLVQIQGIGFGDRVPAQFSGGNGGDVFATVPNGAKTGPIGIQTKGGLAISSAKFTVTK